MCASDSLREKANRKFMTSLKARGLCVILFVCIIGFIQYKDHKRQTELNKIQSNQTKIMNHVGLSQSKH